jgi:DNA-binding beta-propeller fold protein YncE
MRIASLVLASAVAASLLALAASAQPAAAPTGPYKIVKTASVGGQGGMDYVYADADGRKLYIPRGNRVDVYDLDTLKLAGTITPTNGVHGAAVDPLTKHGFCSSNPVVMWDTETLKTIKTIQVTGRPDGILFDPFTQHINILSHSQPNVTVIDSKDGTVLGTIDLTGQPEQGASDGKGKLYISLEDQSKVAVVDSKTMKLLTTYDLAPEGATAKGGAPAGLCMDTKNDILFVSGRTPATCVIMNALDGKIITALPIGNGVDASEFNPNTMEAFISTGQDGKLTIIKETDPKTFAVEQSLTTMRGAKTSTLDSKTNQILLITNDPNAVPATAPAGTPTPPATPPGGRAGRGGPAGVFTILVAGKEAAK